VTLQDVLDARWTEALEVLGAVWTPPEIAWGFGESDHFASARGFATTVIYGPAKFHLKFAQKVVHAPPPRLDALVRHELGHVIDYGTERTALDTWAASRGVVLPDTPERRADAVCEAVWGAPIFYDEEDVQTVLPGGVRPRPERLGL
jgi:hypothetical protein